MGIVPNPGTCPQTSELPGLCGCHSERAARSVQWNPQLWAGTGGGDPWLTPQHARPYSPAVSRTWANLESRQLGVGTQRQTSPSSRTGPWGCLGVGGRRSQAGLTGPRREDTSSVAILRVSFPKQVGVYRRKRAPLYRPECPALRPDSLQRMATANAQEQRATPCCPALRRAWL